MRKREAEALVQPLRSHGNLQRSGMSSAFWEAGLHGALFPLHPETPTTPRFAHLPIANLASRWRSWQHVPGSAYPSPRVLHPISALAVEGLRVQHFVFPGGAQSQLGGTSAVPIPQGLSTLRMALFRPRASRSTYTELVQMPAFHTYFCGSCTKDVSQSGKPSS